MLTYFATVQIYRRPPHRRTSSSICGFETGDPAHAVLSWKRRESGSYRRLGLERRCLDTWPEEIGRAKRENRHTRTTYAGGDNGAANVEGPQVKGTVKGPESTFSRGSLR